MRSTLQAAGLLVIGLAATRQLVHAQEVDAFIGLGSSFASSNGQQIDTFGDGTLHATSSLSGVFTNFGVNVFFNRQVGVGWTGAWKWSAADYAGLQYHASFNIFDGIYQPARIRTKRFSPELRAGIGVAGVHFDYDDPQTCAQVPGCPGSHFFVAHMAVAARYYFTDHVFARPAVNVNYVHDYFPFGRDWVPGFSMSVGYSFGKE